MITIWKSDDFKVIEKENFKSLIAERKFEKGEVVCVVEGEIIEKPNRYSVQIGPNKHINVKEPIMYINHDCDGNITLENKKFIATKSIQKGEEINFDYNSNELELSEPFKCFKCGQIVKGKLFKNKYPCLNLN